MTLKKDLGIFSEIIEYKREIATWILVYLMKMMLVHLH